MFGRMEHKVLVWFIPDLKKSDCEVLVHTSHHSATLPGCRKCQKNESRRVICKWSYKSLLGAQGCRFESREEGFFAFHGFKLMIMIVQCNVTILMPVVYKIV